MLSERVWVTEAVAEPDCDADRVLEVVELAVPVSEVEGVGLPEDEEVMVQVLLGDRVAVKVAVVVGEVEMLAVKVWVPLGDPEGLGVGTMVKVPLMDPDKLTLTEGRCEPV